MGDTAGEKRGMFFDQLSLPARGGYVSLLLQQFPEHLVAPRAWGIPVLSWNICSITFVTPRTWGI